MDGSRLTVVTGSTNSSTFFFLLPFQLRKLPHLHRRLPQLPRPRPPRLLRAEAPDQEGLHQEGATAGGKKAAEEEEEGGHGAGAGDGGGKVDADFVGGAVGAAGRLVRHLREPVGRGGLLLQLIVIIGTKCRTSLIKYRCRYNVHVPVVLKV